MGTVLVEYVGLKDRETDCVAGSGITWVGAGDVQPVDVERWKIMVKHPDVWRLYEGEALPGLGAKTADPSAALMEELSAREAALNARQDTLDEREAALEKFEALLNEREAALAPKAELDLAAMDDEALKALIESKGLQIDKRKKGDALRAAVADALKPAEG